MPTSVIESSSSSGPTVTLSLSSNNEKQQQMQQYDEPSYETNDDDISLASYMSYKIQLDQQITAMNPWMSPHFLTLQQEQHLPIMNEYHPAYNQNSSYAKYHQLKVQYQHQLQIQQQQQQQKFAHGYNELPKSHHHHYRHQHKYNSSASGGKSSANKTRSSHTERHQDSKIKSPPTASPTRRRPQPSGISRSMSLITNSSRTTERRHPQHNLSSPSSSQSSLSSHSERTRKHQRSQQQQYRSNSPVPSLLDDSGARRSSIQSHTSAASSSIKTTSDTTSITNDCSIYSSSTSIFSMSKSTENRLSLSKRIRGVLTGGNNNYSNKQQQYNSSTSLQRSPSLVSCVSSVVTTGTMSDGNGSSRSSWSKLFRKSSKSKPNKDEHTSTIINQKESSMHVKYSNAQKVTMLDSPASSISSASFRYPKLQQDENGTITDLPSPASSTISPESSYSSENSKQLGISTGQQQDYFGLIASQPPNTTPIIPSSLQRGSPTLSPSLKSEQSSNSDDSLSDSNKENDNRSTCLLLESTPTSSLSPPSGLGPQGKRVRTTTTTATMTTAPTIAGKKNTKIRFTTTLRVHDTFGSKDYDRRCDTQVTCQRLTPVLALQIKQELNEYKLNEMVVHSSSRQYTQFFL